MKTLPLLVIACLGTLSVKAVTVTDFIFDFQDLTTYHATVTWTGDGISSAGATLSTEYWVHRNFGVAFLDVYDQGDFLLFKTQYRDTNGLYTPQYVDTFTVALGEFSNDLFKFGSSNHWWYTFHLIDNSPYHFEMGLSLTGPTASNRVPESGTTIGLLCLGVLGVWLVKLRN